MLEPRAVGNDGEGERREHQARLQNMHPALSNGKNLLLRRGGTAAGVWPISSQFADHRGDLRPRKPTRFFLSYN